MKIQEIHNPEDYYAALKRITQAKFKEAKHTRYIVLQNVGNFTVRRIVLKNKQIIESIIPDKEVLL